MASVKVILRSREKKDGTRPIIIQIIKNRRPSIISLGHSILEKDWDFENNRVKKSHPNSARLNNLIIQRIAEVTDKVIELQTAKKDSTAQTIRKSFIGAKDGTFKKQSKIYLDNLSKRGKFNQHSADKPRVERFNEFAGDIGFNDITPALLKRYAAWLKAKEISDRTVVNHLVVVRSIFNQAIGEQVADKKSYPFGKGGIRIKFSDTSKIGLSAEEVKRLEDAKLENNLDHARKVWLFSFYNAGMRISDVLRLKHSDIQDGRLHYTMGKNNKGGSIKLHDKSKKIINSYSENKHDLVFHDLATLPNLSNNNAVQKRIKSRVHDLNAWLKLVANKCDISKKLTLHIARHTFGQLAGDKIALPVLQQLYRHTSIQTTIGYQSHFTTKDTDNALDNVLDF
jgi:site-specific recombinase XerD